MTDARRLWLYEILLDKGIPKNDISDALLRSLRSSELDQMPVAILCLDYGAEIEYKDGLAFTLALAFGNISPFSLLSSQIQNDAVANIAFERTISTQSVKPEIRIAAYNCLLEWNIRRSIIYDALLACLTEHPDMAVLRLLLASDGADPNRDDARCFRVASSLNLNREFRVMCKHAKVETVVRALMDESEDQNKASKWIGICLEERPKTLHHQDTLLFKCISKFPKETELLKCLLSHGVPASAYATCRIFPVGSTEKCSAVIWALVSEPRVENRVILKLLSEGRILDANYLTPQTRVSAAFLCLLDRSRTEILKALLAQNENNVLEQRVSGEILSTIASYPKKPEQDKAPFDIPELLLRDAAIWLGNFEAFELLNPLNTETLSEGALHLTAFLALPEFVKKLLSTYDANQELDEFENMIPLAVCCESQHQPWCKVANQASDFRERQAKTMKLLAAKTNLKWRTSRRLSVLHIALLKGVEVTQAMVTAINLSNDTAKDERYLYEDKSGIWHSPDQYVERISGLSRLYTVPLLQCLSKVKLASRYYRDVLPHFGDQPVGYCGLPVRLATAWVEHEKRLLEYDQETPE